MKTPWSIKSHEECIQSLGSAAFGNGDASCNATWDTAMCWPAARTGTTIRLPCPPLPGIDTSKYGYRTCGADGRWEGAFPNDTRPNGFTNYTECYTKETMDLYTKFYSDKTPEERQMMRDVLQGIRNMDMVGLCLSLVSSALSLLIFSYFRSLRCHRTRIHRNLFVSIIVQVTIRLIVYVDEFVARVKGHQIAGAPAGQSGTIYDTAVVCEILYTMLEYTKTVQFMWMLIEGLYLHNQIAVSVFSKKPNYVIFYFIVVSAVVCEILYTMLEYTKTVQFMWMLIEGLYLHNQIAVSVFSKKPNYVIFYFMGWVAPFPVTLAWAITMARHFGYRSKCWYPYYFLKYIWIIEVPRIAVIAVNLLFLLNIIRVLVLKLNDSHSNEAQVVKVRKAIKAALFLVPLLGISNFVVMFEAPTEALRFAIWSYSSHFLVSFQGFIISLLYCFLNGEVLYTLRKRWHRFNQSRLVHSSSLRRGSRSFSVFTSVTEVPHTQNQFRMTAPPGGYCQGNQIPQNGHAVPLLRDVISRQESGL